MTTFTFDTSITIKGNDGKILFPDFEATVEVNRDSDGKWYVHRIWESYWNGEPTELLLKGELVETGVFMFIADHVEADQDAIDEKFAGSFQDRPEPRWDERATS